MLEVKKLTKIEERLCYDSWWLVETNKGSVRLHQYDGVNPNDLKRKIEMCNNLEALNKLVPTFYFD